MPNDVGMPKGWKGPSLPKEVKEPGDLDKKHPQELLSLAMAPGQNHDIPTQGTVNRYAQMSPFRMKALEMKLGKNETGK